MLHDAHRKLYDGLLFRSKAPLTGQMFRQAATGGAGMNLADQAEPDDSFGHALAAGDFDCDGKDGLAIGVYNEGVGALPLAGAVNVVYGRSPWVTAMETSMIARTWPVRLLASWLTLSASR